MSMRVDLENERKEAFGVNVEDGSILIARLGVFTRDFFL